MTKQNSDNLVEYKIGDKDERSWGSYEVTNVGFDGDEEFCEKDIVVKPKQALSLQRHHMRREIWSVTKGELTAIVDGELKTIVAGQDITIPQKSPHCMINLSDEPVVVHEKQIGVCREEDNDRLCDFGGRDTVPVAEDDAVALNSVALYQQVTLKL